MSIRAFLKHLRLKGIHPPLRRQPPFARYRRAIPDIVHPVFAVRVGVDADFDAVAPGLGNERPVDVEAVGIGVE